MLLGRDTTLRLGANARVRACGVDEREDREAKAAGHFIHTKGFAVPLRIGTAELARDALFECAALQIADHKNWFSVEERHAAGQLLRQPVVEHDHRRRAARAGSTPP